MKCTPEFNTLNNCCLNEEQKTLANGELVDTHGGDYTYQYRYRCTKCRRTWSYCAGAKPEDASYDD